MLVVIFLPGGIIEGLQRVSTYVRGLFGRNAQDHQDKLDEEKQ